MYTSEVPRYTLIAFMWNPSFLFLGGRFMMIGGFSGPMEGDVGSLEGDPSRELVLDSPGELRGDGT